ncbi:MAG: tyrosine-type recombinase/integrase [Acidobacteriaceae bacterium]|nr:tyrosine-type recombinase/integrase [Acidobacteriaceae bacterium]
MTSTISSIVENHIIPKLGKWEDDNKVEHDYLVTDIVASQVKAFFNRVAAEGGSYNKVKRPASESLVKKVVTHTRAILDVCIDDEILAKNPARGKTVKKPKTRKPVRTFLSLEEIGTLLVVARKRSFRDYVLMRVELVAGLRPGELFALRVNDVLEDRLRIDETVVIGEMQDTAKTESSLAPVPLPKRLQEELKLYIAMERIAGHSRELLFPNEIGRVMSTNNYRKRVLQEMGKEIGLPNLTFQMLRRTTATHFQEDGDIKDTQALLRHADAETTLGIYQQTITQKLTAAVQRWDDRMSLIHGGPVQ